MATMEQSDKEMLLDPLDSIKQNGILGFKLGDTEEEVFSRIKALGLLLIRINMKSVINDRNTFR